MGDLQGTLKRLLEQFSALEGRGLIHARLAEEPVFTQSEVTDRLWTPKFGDPFEVMREHHHELGPILYRVSRKSPQLAEHLVANPEPFADPPFDMHGNPRLLDAGGEILVIQCGAIRSVRLSWNEAPIDEFISLAVAAGVVLENAPTPVRQLLADDTLKVDAFLLRWVFALFDLARAEAPHSPLRVSRGGTVTIASSTKKQQPSASNRTRPLLRKKRAPRKATASRGPIPLRPSWYTDLDDLVRSSVYALDIFLNTGAKSSLDPADEPRYMYWLQGANYKVRFEGEQGDIPADFQGARYVDELLHHPHTTYPATELRALRAPKQGVPEDQATHPEGKYEGQVHTRGRPIHSQRKEAQDELSNLLAGPDGLFALVEDLADAEEAGDHGRAEELSKVVDRLKANVKSRLRGGKVEIKGREVILPRWVRTGSDPDVERARVSIAAAIKLIADKCKEKWALPRLGAHLRRYIDTGDNISYRPTNPPPDWK